MELKVLLVVQDHKDLKVLLVTKVLKEQQETRVLQEQLDHKDQLEVQDLLDLLDHKEIRVLVVTKDQLVNQLVYNITLTQVHQWLTPVQENSD